MNSKSNLWILTEERPKINVLQTIFKKFANDYKFAIFLDLIRILPILDNGNFTFIYEVIGFKCAHVDRIFIKTISGNSSCVDFLVFFQNSEPLVNDVPIYAIEETKTDDKESRNTGVYQRCSKFVFIEYYYPGIKKIMLYNLQVQQKNNPTQTYIFGTKLLMTLGVEIIGKTLDKSIFTKFKNIDEVVTLKASMRKAPKGNVPILINKFRNRIEVSGRLFKSNSLSHDPNIGAISIICAVLRMLGWKDRIIVTQHGLNQSHVGLTNKFIQIANKLHIELDNLVIPSSKMSVNYWKYDIQGEKLGTIFIHIVIETFTKGYSIFENHAGCEKGYFIPLKGNPIPLEKYKDRVKYKMGDKNQIIHIPDLIIIDFARTEIINIEGKKYLFKQNGIDELKNYDNIEKLYIKKHYPNFKLTRTVVLFGSSEKTLIEVEIGFLLNDKGDLILGVKAPQIFKEAILNLLDFWT